MNVTLKRMQQVDFSVQAPPSKSYTHRALIAAALAHGTSEIHQPLVAGDTTLTRDALSELGIPITELGKILRVEGCGGVIPCSGELLIDCKNSGSSIRFLTSVALLCQYPVILTGDARMRERPIGPLVSSLNDLGGAISYVGRQNFPPVNVSGHLRGGHTTIDSTVSSQFISSILLAAPCAEENIDIEILGIPVSESYLDITTDVMQGFGTDVTRDGYRRFRVRPGRYASRSYLIEGDWSSASYFFAIAAVCGGRVRVENLNPVSPQGDRIIIAALEAMGCRVQISGNGVELERDGPLDGIDINMAIAPDTIQTLAAVAAFATGETRISGISHLRFKESDRIAAIIRVLGSLGVRVHVKEDMIIIRPGSIHGGEIDPKNDHRTAMAGAVLGLGAGNITINESECVAKSFPGYWDTLKEAGLWIV